MTVQGRIESLSASSASLRAQLNELGALRDRINRAEALTEGEGVKSSDEQQRARSERMHAWVG